MSEKIKLTYFDARGRAEISRQILHAGGIPFEDVRIKREDWMNLKPNTPLGQMPLLDIDGVQISQSMAIARLCARKAGLAGKTDIEQAQADMAVDHINDYLAKFTPILFKSDPEEKKKLSEEFLAETLPTFLETSEKLLKSRGGKFLAGSSLTWADIHMTIGLDLILDPNQFKGVSGEEKRQEFAAQNPCLASLRKSVHDIPGIKTWLSQRPETAI